MTASASTVFLVDVDNTLLDNDAVEADLHRHLAAQLGQERAERYWTIFEELRNELGNAGSKLVAARNAKSRFAAAFARLYETCLRPGQTRVIEQPALVP